MADTCDYNEVSLRDLIIDVLRGIGILLMVAGHMHFSESFNHYIFSFHMPLFFIISGYCYHKVSHLSEAVVGKAKKILVPYAFFGFTYYFLVSCNSIVIGKAVSFKPLVALLFHGTDNLPLESALWFLPALFIAWLMLSLILKIPNKPIRGITTIVITTVGCLLGG